MPDAPRFYTVAEVAAMYAVSPDKVYLDIRRGFLPAVTVGRAIRIRQNDARGYVRELDDAPLSLTIHGRRPS